MLIPESLSSSGIFPCSLAACLWAAIFARSSLTCVVVVIKGMSSLSRCLNAVTLSSIWKSR